MKTEKVNTLTWQLVNWRQWLDQLMCPVTVTGGEGLCRGYALLTNKGETFLFYTANWEDSRHYPVDTDLMVFGHHSTIGSFMAAQKDRRQQDLDDTAPKHFFMTEAELALINKALEEKDKEIIALNAKINKVIAIFGEPDDEED